MSDEKWNLIVCDDGRLIVATAGDIVCHTDPNHAPGDEWDAKNFRKITAIPDLLDAVQRAEAMIELMRSTAYQVGLEGTKEWDEIVGGSDMQGTYCVILAAIAKAAGEVA